MRWCLIGEEDDKNHYDILNGYISRHNHRCFRVVIVLDEILCRIEERRRFGPCITLVPSQTYRLVTLESTLNKMRYSHMIGKVLGVNLVTMPIEDQFPVFIIAILEPTKLVSTSF